MAAKTPVTATSTSGYVDPDRGYYGYTSAATDTHLTNGAAGGNRERLRHLVFYFSDVDDADTWASGITGIAFTAWQGNDLDGDQVNTGVSTRAAGGDTVRFDCASADSKGWLHVFVAG